MAGSLPLARFSAAQTSRSRLEPGKMMTAAFMPPRWSAVVRPSRLPSVAPQDEDGHCMPSARPPHPEALCEAKPRRTHPRFCGVRSFQLDRVVFDDRVGEQFSAHRLDLGLSRGAVRAVDLDLDQLALAHLADPGETQRGKRIADRLTLRVEHARFEADMNARFH